MERPLILVTGATGTIGQHVVEQLAAAGHRVRALVRMPSKARFERSVEVIQGDCGELETLGPAFRGADKALVVLNGLDLAALEANAFAAAKAAGVKHVVKISGRHVDADFLAGSVLALWHGQSESRLRALGTRWTILRPGVLASNMLLWLNRTEGTVSLPVGEGKDAPADPRDIAAVAVKVLTSSGHDGATYELTGPALLSFSEMVRKMAIATGRSLRFVDVPKESARAGMIAGGVPSSQADALLMLFDGIKAGKAYPPTAAIAELLGRPARNFDDWVRDNIAALRA